MGSAYLQQNVLCGSRSDVGEIDRSATNRRGSIQPGNGLFLRSFEIFSDSARIYEEAVQVDDDNYEVREIWGMYLTDRTPGSRSKAESAYEKAISLAGAALAVDLCDVNALGYAAEYQAMLGQKKEAMKYLERASD